MPSCWPKTSPRVSTISPSPGNRSSDVLSFEIAIDEAGIVAVGNKTDLLRLCFLGNCQAVIARHVAHFRLRHLAQRKHRARKLILCQLPKKVGLVLLLIAPAEETVAICALVVFNARVMSGGDFLAAKTCRKIDRAKQTSDDCCRRRRGSVFRHSNNS